MGDSGASQSPNVTLRAVNVGNTQIQIMMASWCRVGGGVGLGSVLGGAGHGGPRFRCRSSVHAGGVDRTVRCRFREPPVASAPWGTRRRSRTCWPRSAPAYGGCGATGVTLTALAAQTGISKSTLSRLESGQRKPSLELLLPAGRGSSPAARRARRRAAGRRSPRPDSSQDPQRPARLPADAAVQRHGRVEGRHPARAGTQAPHPRRPRVAVRARGRDAPDPRRARHHDAARARSPSSTPGCRTGSARPATSRSRSSACTAATASGCTSARRRARHETA